jgi:mevalonate kinase
VKVIATKNIFSQMESFFTEKFRLDPLNSYLSIPILINSKDNIEATGIPNQTLDEKALCFVRFRNCWRNRPYGHYIHGKPKR